MGLKGTNAAIRYTPEGTTSPTTVKLNWPIEQTPRGDGGMELVRRGGRREGRSLDYGTREVVSFTTNSVREIRAKVRFHDDATELLDMLVAGANGQTLTYFPDLSSTGENFPSKLIHEGDDVEIQPDSDRQGLGEWQADIHLRHATGGDYNGLLPNT